MGFEQTDSRGNERAEEPNSGETYNRTKFRNSFRPLPRGASSLARSLQSRAAVSSPLQIEMKNERASGKWLRLSSAIRLRRLVRLAMKGKQRSAEPCHSPHLPAGAGSFFTFRLFTFLRRSSEVCAIK
jgi:hypothetical protein